MKRKPFTEQQIPFALRQAETGTPVGEAVQAEGVENVTTIVKWSR